MQVAYFDHVLGWRIGRWRGIGWWWNKWFVNKIAYGSVDRTDVGEILKFIHIYPLHPSPSERAGRSMYTISGTHRSVATKVRFVGFEINRNEQASLVSIETNRIRKHRFCHPYCHFKDGRGTEMDGTLWYRRVHMYSPPRWHSRLS